MLLSYSPYRISGHNDTYNPFEELENVGYELMRSSRLGAFRTDITEKDGVYTLESELPGIKKEDITIDVHDNVLTITAKKQNEETEENKDKHYLRKERVNGTFTRSFDVTGIDQDHISAAFDNGVLTLTLPTASPEKPEKKSISIN